MRNSKQIIMRTDKISWWKSKMIVLKYKHLWLYLNITYKNILNMKLNTVFLLGCFFSCGPFWSRFTSDYLLPGLHTIFFQTTLFLLWKPLKRITEMVYAKYAVETVRFVGASHSYITSFHMGLELINWIKLRTKS